jgi:hypothetical protein
MQVLPARAEKTEMNVTIARILQTRVQTIGGHDSQRNTQKMLDYQAEVRSRGVCGTTGLRCLASSAFVLVPGTWFLVFGAYSSAH